MRTKWIWLLALALVAAACATDNGDESTTDDTGETGNGAAETGNGAAETGNGEEQANGGTISIAVPPLESPDLSAEWAYDLQRTVELGNIFEPLVDRDPETSEIIGVLATSWEQPNERTYRFQLREGVEFHDGTPFDAEAAVTSLSHVLRPESRQIDLGHQLYEFEAVGEYEIEMRFEDPDPLILQRMTIVQLIPPWQADDEESYTSEPIGTGPYKLADYEAESRWTLELNEDWWGHDAEDAYGEAVWDTVVFDVRPETATRRAALEAGEVDFAFDIGQQGCEEVGDACVVLPRAGEVMDIRYDVPSSMMGDIRVREALDLAFDREAIAQEIYGEGVEATGQVVAPGAAGYVEDIEPHPYDPERARELLEEAEADGTEVDETITLVSQQGRFERSSEVLQAIQFSWEEALGIDVDVAILEAQEYGELYRRQNGPMHESVAEDRHIVIVTTGHDWSRQDLGEYGRGRYPCGAVLSVMCDEDFSERLEEARAATGDERHELLQEINREVYEQHHWSTILRWPRFHGVSDSVNFRPRADGWVHITDFTPAS